MSENQVDESGFFSLYREREFVVKLVDGSTIRGMISRYNDLSIYLTVAGRTPIVRLIPRTAILYIEPSELDS